ncbi:MAG: hypothetical protein NTW52_13545 [Planctomycetota bacterium]|nr:hypothetical protein [Planctomycetota bacterium]
MSTDTARVNQSLGKQLSDSVWVPLIVGFLCFVQIGCTPFENRWRRSTAMDPSLEDDWAPPKVNGQAAAYRTPKQFRSAASQAVAKPPNDKSTNSLATTKDPQRASYKSPNSGADLQKTDVAKSSETKRDAVELANSQSTNRRIGDKETSKLTSDSKNESNVIETDPQELDLDGAIAALPPNMQVVLKRQLDALEKRDQEAYALTSQKNPSQTPEKKVSMRITDSESKSIETPTTSIAINTLSTKQQALASPTVDAVSSAAIISQITQPNSDSPSQSSLVAVSKESTAQPQAPLATGPVQQASAIIATNNVSSPGVVTASATLPVNSNQSNVTFASPSSASPTSAGAQWNHDLAGSIAKLEKQLKESPSSDESVRISQEMTLRMLYVANRQLEEAMRPIEGLTESERDYMRHQAQALYEASNPDAMPVKSRKWSLVMNSQRAATDQLAAVSNLDVKTVAFCTDVQGYGVITKFPNNSFKPDQDLLLYCELENVAADEVKEGYETQLQGSYEIIDPNGRRIADQLLPMEKEICQNHRRDYFIVYRIYTPMQIGPGNYQLRLTVEDMKAKKFGQASLDFQIQK